MEQEKEKLGIEPGDFITPKKAITISTISLLIWFVTGLSFKLVSTLWNVPYETFALVVSLSLSVFFSIYIVRMLVRKADIFMKIIIGLLNTMLIYTSANGAQATYSFLSPAGSDTGQVQKGSLIPFLDARPWIPDKALITENDNLVNENKKLILEQEELSTQNGMLQTRLNLLTDSLNAAPVGTRNSNLLLRDTLAMLNNRLSECRKQNVALSLEVRKLQSKSSGRGTLKKPPR